MKRGPGARYQQDAEREGEDGQRCQRFHAGHMSQKEVQAG